MNLTANGRVHDLSANELGSVAIEPGTDIEVGSFGTWKVIYRVGRYGIDVGGGLRIGTRRMADWGVPQFDNPGAPNHVTVAASVPASFALRYEPRGHVRPFRAVIDVQLTGHPLHPGDEVTLVLGDRSHGSPGMLAQSFPETECEIAAFVDCLSSGEYVRVPQLSPPLRVIPGPAERLEIQAPSTAVAGRPFRVQVRAVDRFGNPTPVDCAGLVLEAEPEVGFALSRADGRAKWLEGVRLGTTGQRRLVLHADGEPVAVSNPVLVRSEPDGPDLYWGDTQGQTASTVGAGSVAEYFAYGRDLAGIDFLTHQGNDFMLSEEAWEEVRSETARFNEPGRFTAILGYEWSGATGAGGDRNLLYSGDDGPIFRSSSWQIERRLKDGECSSARDLHAALHETARRHGTDVLLIPHVGGRRSDVDVYDADLEHLIEICSCHGLFEWRLFEALARGQRVGVVGASDDHTGRPGLAFPSTSEMAIRGGLTGVYADRPERGAIFQALKARRCYATTGARILLRVEADGQPMGTALASLTTPSIDVEAAGTAPLDEITLFDGARVVRSHEPNPRVRDPRRLRLTWTGAHHQDRNRAVRWHGGLRLSAGSIVEAVPLNMYAPKQGIVAHSLEEVRWESVTASHTEGVLLTLDALDDAEVRFEAGPAQFAFTLGEVRTGDVETSWGGLGIGVTASTLHPMGEVEQVRLRMDDPESGSGSGEHAYHVRVIQRDFARAWSSPIFVTGDQR